MQGYYLYTVYGTTEELKEFNKKLEEIADTDEILQSLNNEKTLEFIEGEYTDPKIEMGTYMGSGNISGAPYAVDVEDTMNVLAKNFPEYKIYGEGELLDFANSKQVFVSEKGSSTCEQENDDDPLNLYCDFEHYLPDTDEFEMGEDSVGFGLFGNIPADEFRNDEGIIVPNVGDEYIELESSITQEEYGRDAYIYFYTFDNLFITDMDHYDESSDTFTAYQTYYDNTFDVPGDKFKDENDEFVKKQVPVERDGQYYFVTLNI